MKDGAKTGSKSIHLPAFVRQAAIASSLFYLIVPNIAFLAGWVTPWVAVPLSALIIVAGIQACRYGIPGGGIIIRTSDAFCLLLTLLFLSLCVLSISLHGFIPQSGDMSIRNAMYNTLITCDWPLYSPREEYFVYYMGVWLPCALICKAFPCLDPQSVLSLYIFVSLALAAILLFFKLRGRVLFFFLFLFVSGNMPFLSFNAIMEGFRHCLDSYASFCGLNNLIMKTLDVRIWFPCWIIPLCNSSHHTAYFTLMMAFILCKALPDKCILFVAALGLLSSPLASVALLFFLIIRFFYRWAASGQFPCPILINPYTLVGILLCAIAALWYRTGTGSLILFLPQLIPGHPALLAHAFVVIGLALLPLVLFISREYRRTSLFKAALILPFLLYFIIIGGFREGSDIIVNNNELALKGAIVIHTLASFLLACQYRHAKGAKGLFLILYLISCGGQLYSKVDFCVTNFTLEPQQMEANKLNDWNGHLDHPEDEYTHRIFWTTTPVPPLFLQHAGESAQGLLSPFATGQVSCGARPQASAKHEFNIDFGGTWW